MPAPPTPELFKGLHFDREVVILCVRWYVSYKLSSRDLVNMMDERGMELAHTTILRWVQRYVPEFEKRGNHYARSVGGSWRCDETYIKVKGHWTICIVPSTNRAEPWIFCFRRGGMSPPPNASFRRR